MTELQTGRPQRSRAEGSTKAARRRGRLLWTALGLLVVLVAVIGSLGRSGSSGEPLGPGNPAPEGAMAVAEVLGSRGVDVRVPAGYDQALDALGPDTTLLLHDPNGWLDAERLQALAGRSSRVVLLRPDFAQLSAAAPQISAAGLVPESLATGDGDGPRELHAGCPAADASAARTIDAGGQLYRGPVTCFPLPDGPADAGSYAATADGTAVVLGNPDLLANSTVASRGNAALVLRTLGSEPTLVWFSPTPADVLPADDAAQAPPLPDWVGPVAAWLVIVAAFAAFAAGRRLGPLAVEPLPVLVRSSETAEGRARLYQDGRAADRAAQVLRSGTKVRLARFLRLHSTTGPQQLAAAVAAAADRPVHEVQQLLYGPLPADDADLVRWAQSIQQLEEEVLGS